MKKLPESSLKALIFASTPLSDGGRDIAAQKRAPKKLARPARVQSPRRRLAVVDIGSNSVRLVVFAGDEAVPTILYNEKILCGLGRSLAQSNQLHPSAIPIALDNLERFIAIAAAMSCEGLELLATAAVREAEDGARFVAKIEALYGHPVRVLSGVEEAQLAAQGVLWGTPGATGLIGDLGGGSLELIAVRDGAIHQQATLPLGCLRLEAEVAGGGKALRRHIDDALQSLAWLGDLQRPAIMAVGGAWRALGRLQMAWEDYPLRIIHGYGLPRSRIKELSALIAQQQGASLRKLSAVSAKRIDTLPIAALVLGRLVAQAEARRVEFSAYGLREGWLWGQRRRDLEGCDPLLDFAREWAARDARITDLGAAITGFTAALFPNETAEDLRLRRVVGHLTDIAWREHPEYRAKRALERILSAATMAADHAERVFIALAIYWRYGGGETPVPAAALLPDARQGKARLLGLALRLADAVAAGSADLLGSCRLVLESGQARLEIGDAGPHRPGDRVERRLAQLNRFVRERADADLLPR